MVVKIIRWQKANVCDFDDEKSCDPQTKENCASCWLNTNTGKRRHAGKQKQGGQFKATSAHWDRLWENIEKINKGEMMI